MSIHFESSFEEKVDRLYKSNNYDELFSLAASIRSEDTDKATLIVPMLNRLLRRKEKIAYRREKVIIIFARHNFSDGIVRGGNTIFSESISPGLSDDEFKLHIESISSILLGLNIRRNRFPWI